MGHELNSIFVILTGMMAQVLAVARTRTRSSMILLYTIWIIRLILWFAGSWYLPTILILNLARRTV